MLGDVWSNMIFHVAVSTWTVAGLLVGSCVLLWVLTHVPAVQRRLVAHASTVAGLGLPHASHPMVLAAQVRRVRGFSGGGFLGVIVSIFLVYFIGADRSGSATVFLLGGFVIVGVLGGAIAAVAGEVARTGEGERVAHGRRTRLADYVPRWERVGVRGTVFLNLAVVGVLILLPVFWKLQLSVFPQSFSVAVVVAGLAVALLAAFEIGGRIVVARPQTMASEQELAWDDAMRSAAILDLVAAAFLLGAFGVFFGLQEIAMAVRPGIGGGVASVESFNLFGLVVLGAGAAASVLTSSRRHFRRTLHADAGSRPVGPQ
ncbi:hypothetical protein [Cryobacterium sp. M96]|uniref:hypothetical protein n=1 Tax=Cryobacterium sp. M96 TaxID=2048295 RepID=UPI000CE4316C|nr:hypothetical protein [Cryobacterium sp. M96]